MTTDELRAYMQPIIDFLIPPPVERPEVKRTYPDRLRPTGPNKSKGISLKPVPPHGDPLRYNHRTAPCRCDKCKEAHSLDQKLYRNRLKNRNAKKR